jgi:hypothetical protein
VCRVPYTVPIPDVTFEHDFVFIPTASNCAGVSLPRRPYSSVDHGRPIPEIYDVSCTTSNQLIVNV